MCGEDHPQLLRVGRDPRLGCNTQMRPEHSLQTAVEHRCPEEVNWGRGFHGHSWKTE